MNIPNAVRFLCKWLTHPKTTGAVCPSSRFLARRMARGVGDKKNGIVVELGAGTGAVTKYLIAEGCGKTALYCIEFDAALSETLRRQYPTAIIANDSAENIRTIVGKDAGLITAIVSSLPLLSLPDFIVKNIINEVEASLPTGGRFVQYTYNLKRNPDSLGFKNMRHVGVSRVFLNIPPARVDVFEKI